MGAVRNNAIVADMNVESVHPEVSGRSGVGADDAVLLWQVVLAECLVTPVSEKTS